MPEIREPKESRNSELSRLVEQSLNRLHEMERRIQLVQSELFTLSSAPAYAPNASSATGSISPGFGNVNAAPFTAQIPSGASPGIGVFSGTASPGFTPFAFAPMGNPFSSSPLGPASPNGPSQFAYAPTSPRPSFATLLPQAAAPFARDPHTSRELRNLPAQPRIPEVNFVDSGEKYLIHVELPGVKKDNLDLTVTERTITVEAEVKPDLPDGTVLVAEALPVMFRRTIALPTACNSSKCKATLKDGFLTLDLPKREPTERPHRVDVAYG